MNFFKRFLIAVLTVILAISLVACDERTPQSAEGFTDTMESEGFTVVDSTIFAQTAVTADKVLTALNDNYEIEFYELDCIPTAKDFHQLNKDAFESEDSVSDNSTEINSSNFDYYDMTSDTGFHLSTRIDNTVIYCYTEAEYKEEIIKLVKALGYK
ncbi:MAG: hypothetical protein E7513_06130 [Ruminococcaceae bacterium]|nr:hypothetical protein [Oscillospiraceae bacterium]